MQYRQFQFIERLSAAGPEELRTGFYRNEDDVAVIAANVAKFVGHVDVLYTSELAHVSSIACPVQVK